MVIFGLGEFAEIADRAFSKEQCFFTVHKEYLREQTFRGKMVRPFEDIPPETMFIAIGNNKNREKIYLEALEREFPLATFIDRKATIDTELRARKNAIGTHCFIMENNNIQPHVTIGRNTILWAGNHIGHHTKIGNHCFITSHVCISGGCTIGDRTFIGVNASVIDHVKIGADCIIAAGAVVDRDIPDRYILSRKGTLHEVGKAEELAS